MAVRRARRADQERSGAWQGLGAAAAGLLVGALALGCGPVTTASTISDAERDMEEAQALEAARRAPYEYTKARALLDKAKELEGYGAFEAAAAFARQSRLMAEKALDVARLAAEREKRDAHFKAPTGSPGRNRPPHQRGSDE